MKIGRILVVAFLGLLLLVAVGCGGDDGEKPTATSPPSDTPTTAPTDTPTSAEPTDTPTSAGPTDTPASAGPTDTPPAATGGGPAATLTIGTPGDELKYDTNRLEVKAGQTVTVKYENNSSVFKHNWILVQPGTKDDVAREGIAAGDAEDYVQPGDDRVIATLKLVDPGKTGEITFPAPLAGSYEFVCTFPGHNATKFGDFIVTG